MVKRKQGGREVEDDEGRLALMTERASLLKARELRLPPPRTPSRLTLALAVLLRSPAALILAATREPGSLGARSFACVRRCVLAVGVRIMRALLVAAAGRGR